jgi:hypothetical protein
VAVRLLGDTAGVCQPPWMANLGAKSPHPNPSICLVRPSGGRASRHQCRGGEGGWVVTPEQRGRVAGRAEDRAPRISTASARAGAVRRMVRSAASTMAICVGSTSEPRSPVRAAARRPASCGVLAEGGRPAQRCRGEAPRTLAIAAHLHRRAR